MTRNRRSIVFSVVLLLFSLTFWLSSMLNQGEYVNNYFHNCVDNSFMDYYNMLATQGNENPYVVAADETNTVFLYSNYPPMAIVVWKIMYSLIPLEYRTNNADFLRLENHAVLGLILAIGLSIMIIGYVLHKSQDSDLEGKLFEFSILFSGPFLFAIERGNIIVLAFAFLMIYIAFYNSSKKVLRYMAYICLAIASALKIYPAVFGVLIIKNKRYKEAVLTIICGLLFFFAPFFLLNGFESISNMIDGYTLSITGETAKGLGFKVDFDNFIRILGAAIGLHSFEIHRLVKIIPVSIVLIMYFTSNEEWKKTFALALACCWIPDFSYIYTLILFIIPLMQFLKTQKENIFFVSTYMIGFWIILMPTALPSIEWMDIVDAKYPLTGSTLIINVCLAVFALSILLENYIAWINISKGSCMKEQS